MISFIIPVYNEEDNIDRVIDEIISVYQETGTYEIIVVDDGSTDNTLEMIRRRSEGNRDIRAISVPHKGQTAAIRKGLESFQGDTVVLMDGDLQSSASDVPYMVNLLKENDAVLGFRKERKDPLFLKVIPSKIANLLLSALFEFKVNDYGCALRILKKDIADKLKHHLYCEGMHRFIPYFISLYSNDIIQIPVVHRRRQKGVSKNGLERVPIVLYHMLTLRLGNVFPAEGIVNGIFAVFIFLSILFLGVLNIVLGSKDIRRIIRYLFSVSFFWLYYNIVLDIINTKKNN